MIDTGNNQFERTEPDDDPIVDEVRRVREELFARFNYDLRAFGKFLQERTEESIRAGRKVVSPAPRPARSSRNPTKKID